MKPALAVAIDALTARLERLAEAAGADGTPLLAASASPSSLVGPLVVRRAGRKLRVTL